MKVSYYNIYSDIGSETVIYNTLYDGLIIVPKQIADMVRHHKIEFIDLKELNYLQEAGIIIEDQCNELDFYQQCRKYHRVHEQRMHVMLTITNICNCSCEYCFEAKQKNKVISKSGLEVIRKFIIENLKIHSIKTLCIDFFGGEPLLFPEIVIREMEYYIEECANVKVSVKFRFYTNGTLINSDLLLFCAKNKECIKDFQITLDGPKNIHDLQRPLKNKLSSYDITTRNFQRLNQNGIDFVIRINVNKKNINEIEKLLDELDKLGLSGCKLAFYGIQSMSHACADYQFAFEGNEFSFVKIKLIVLARSKGFKVSYGLSPSYLYCSAHCRDSYIINYKLDVFKCALLQSDDQYKIGHLDDNGNLKIEGNVLSDWNNSSPLSEPKCRKCVLLPLCGGGCSGVSKFKTGKYAAGLCGDYNIKVIKQVLKNMYERGDF